MRDAQSDPRVAKRFLLERKVPYLAKSVSEPIYFESSHLYCKGFINAWLQISELPTPDLIVLRRPPRKVARSMMGLNTVPGRTERGLRWYLAPADPSNVTSLQGWRSLSDYQLCYWYCLEIEQRQEKYADEISSLGGTVVKCTTSSVATWSGFNRVRRGLNLPAFTATGLLRYVRNAGKRINSQSKYKSDNIPHHSESHLDRLEAEVIEKTVPKYEVSQ
jgi:hypothetical protein